MGTGRLEAFSDGVLAIVLTVMVLELKVPHGDSLHALAPLLSPFLGYVLSFVYVGIYWNNHHHLLHAARTVTGGVLWANLHLLFWLSLLPVTTGWAGEHPLAPVPAACYGGVLLMAAVAYRVLQTVIIAANGPDSVLKTAVGADVKGTASLGLYAAAVPAAFWEPVAAHAVYAAVALIWLVPDRRIERRVGHPGG